MTENKNYKFPVTPRGQLRELISKIRNSGKVSAFGMPFYNRVISAALIAEDVFGNVFEDFSSDAVYNPLYNQINPTLPLRNKTSAYNQTNINLSPISKNPTYNQPNINSESANVIIYVCADFALARDAFEELNCLCGKNVTLLPAKDDVLSYRKSQSGDNAIVRFKAMMDVCLQRAKILVTTAEALGQLYPQRAKFQNSIVSIVKGKEYDLYSLVARLTHGGYKREAQVAGAGQFSLRGDILDVWAAGENLGYRIEFFGDEAETIKLFDLGEQISDKEILSVEICPNTELFLSDNESTDICKQLNQSLKSLKNPPERIESIISDVVLRLSGGDRDKSLSYVLPLSGAVSFSDFFQPKTIIYDDAKSVFDAVKISYTEHFSRFKSLLEKGEVLPYAVGQMIDEDSVFKIVTEGLLAYHKVTSANRIFTPNATVSFSINPVSDYTRDYRQLTDDVISWAEHGYKVSVFCGNDKVLENLSAIFTDNRVGFCNDFSSNVTLCANKLSHGAIFHEEKSVIIGTYDITRKSAKKTLKRSKRDVFVEPAVGDYVVHNVHGIGVCDEITRLDLGGVSRDYVVVRYRDGDKLYVPIENMDSLSKLIAGEEHPKLSKIGGADFAKVKERVKASVKAMAINLLALYAERAKIKGYKYSDDNSLLDEFCGDFPYEETDDQLTAAAEGLSDLTSGKVMDRLLCGDVGYGKTEVALRLAFKVIAEGKQVAFVSPTTILATQHYNTVIKRMERFGVKVGALSRFVSDKEVEKTLQGLADGKVDIVCGTHRVLSKDVKFKDLGLLILDEEQRFGVADKEKIKQLKLSVNVLSLSATPIPRTLHMSMVGIRDISILDTPPAERIPVQTYVTEYTETLAADVINREVNRGGQVFIVFNRVAEIEKFAASIKRLLPSVSLSVAHGQMPEGKLEKIIASFVAGESEVLIASTIIENGIDIPRANTMIVVDADRLGLSQLYQLRGRVGRSNRLSYVYFTFDGGKILTETAYKRLDAITQFTEFGSGFKIAMRDLEIRGAGNILGREQHGHIEKVGYDMYCKLLEDAVKELSGEKSAEQAAELKVITDFNAFISETYVPDNEWRVRLYSRISRLNSLDEMNKLTGDLTDIYGKPPDSVANLLTVGLVKNLALKLGAISVTLKHKECSITLSDKPLSEVALKLITLAPDIKLSGDAKRLVFGTGAGARKVMINFLLNCHKN